MQTRDKLQPECVNQSRKRRRLLSPARVVKKEPRKRLAPILQHANELAVREMLCNLILPHESESDAVNGSSNNDLHVVDDQRPIDRNGQRFSPLLELPAINLAAMPVAKINARQSEQVARSFGLRCDLKYAREPTMAARWSSDTRTAIISF